MKSATYSFEPKEFESLHLDRSTEIGRMMCYSKQKTTLAPPILQGYDENISINMPNKVVINTDKIDIMKWEDVKLPVCIRYNFSNKAYQRQREHFVFLKDIQTRKIVQVDVHLDFYDGIDIYEFDIIPDGQVHGGTFTYDILFFKELPKYSSEYEVWVKIADLESNHVRVKLDLFSGGERVPHPDVKEYISGQ